MKKLTKLIQHSFILAFLISSLSTTANAIVTGRHKMDFDNTTQNPLFFVKNTNNDPFSVDENIVKFPFTIEDGAPEPDMRERLEQDGIRIRGGGFDFLQFPEPPGTGRLRYKIGNSGSSAVAFESDSGGASIDLVDYEFSLLVDDQQPFAFALESVYFGAISHNVKVTGHTPNLVDFQTVVSSSSANSTVDLLSLNAGFANVTTVVFWFDGVDSTHVGPIGGSITLDDIVISAADPDTPNPNPPGPGGVISDPPPPAPTPNPVPVPAAVWLFVSALSGLSFFRSNRARVGA